MHRGDGNRVAHGYLGEIFRRPAFSGRISDVRVGDFFCQVEFKGCSELVLVELVYEFFRLVLIVSPGQITECVVAGDLNTVSDRDVRSAVLPFLIDYVFVRLFFVAREYAVISRDGLVYVCDVAIFNSCHQSGDLEHGTWFSSPGDGYVLVLSE